MNSNMMNLKLPLDKIDQAYLQKQQAYNNFKETDD